MLFYHRLRIFLFFYCSCPLMISLVIPLLQLYLFTSAIISMSPLKLEVTFPPRHFDHASFYLAKMGMASVSLRMKSGILTSSFYALCKHYPPGCLLWPVQEQWVQSPVLVFILFPLLDFLKSKYFMFEMSFCLPPIPK